MKAVVLVFALLAVGCVLADSGKGKSDRCHGKKDGTRFVDTKDCHKYAECADGKEKSKSCSSSQNFDAGSMKCVSKSRANCFSAPAPTTAAPTPVCNTTYAKDCTMYWSCETGTPTLKACLEGYFYFEQMHLCVPGDVQGCVLYHV